MSRAPFLLLALLLAVGAVAPLAAAQGAGAPGIVHTPPTSAAPGRQIDLLAVLMNATAGVVLWNNGSLPKAAAVPMTNLSQAQDGGWVYEAWLPAQADGTQVTYSITATGPAGADTQSYSLTVASAGSAGLTQADLDHWILTLMATLAMAASTVVAIYYYISLRLRRERE